MELISLHGKAPLGRQIIATGSDSASQFLAYCSGTAKQTEPYLWCGHYTWALHPAESLLSPFPVFLAIYMSDPQHYLSNIDSISIWLSTLPGKFYVYLES